MRDSTAGVKAGDENEQHHQLGGRQKGSAGHDLSAYALLQEKARKLRETLENHPMITELDNQLFLQTVDTVIIHPDGIVSLKLINGQIIQNTEERSDPPCKQQNALHSPKLS